MILHLKFCSEAAMLKIISLVFDQSMDSIFTSYKIYMEKLSRCLDLNRLEARSMIERFVFRGQSRLEVQLIAVDCSCLQLFAIVCSCLRVVDEFVLVF